MSCLKICLVLAGEDRVEVINAMTGKAEFTGASRLCKQSLFRMFCEVLDKVPKPTTLPDNAKEELYSVLKAKSEDYQVQYSLCYPVICQS